MQIGQLGEGLLARIDGRWRRRGRVGLSSSHLSALAGMEARRSCRLDAGDGRRERELGESESGDAGPAWWREETHEEKKSDVVCPRDAQEQRPRQL